MSTYSIELTKIPIKYIYRQKDTLELTIIIFQINQMYMFFVEDFGAC